MNTCRTGAKRVKSLLPQQADHDISLHASPSVGASVPYVALREPTGDEAWNLYCLRRAARLKRKLVGVYYSPKLLRLLALFKVSHSDRVDDEVFERVDPSLLEEAYRMECPPGCGKCCAKFSGAFALDVEVEELPSEVGQRVRAQPSRLVRTRRGYVRVYELGTGPAGMCIFYDAQRRACKLEELGKGYKPVVCLLTYCTIFASRGGKLYLKAAARRVEGGWWLVYREVGEDEWRRALLRMQARPRRGINQR